MLYFLAYGRPLLIDGQVLVVCAVDGPDGLGAGAHHAAQLALVAGLAPAHGKGAE